ncbi:type II secretion system protein [Planomicrobium sp. CPCC 101079]|uniref:type II secretion system protein n=1 Tax=Planomicrobium sp. CPCC 101079 TaxID=2599618 RepID=UPI0011B742E9|nr:type II secretion system protein [Planomicrobium sp. CPCC 101079]TWT08961.1 type II secretion system protein [Planomicrobium sp. CPCC 101079]
MKSEDGVTLVELLGGLVIIGIIVVSIMSVFSNGIKSSERTTSRQEIQQEANLVVEKIRSAYLQNEKNELITEEFIVKKQGQKLEISEISETGSTINKVISEGYHYQLFMTQTDGTTGSVEELVLDRSITSPFHLKICPKSATGDCPSNQGFEIQTSFSKLN